ncbi:hypothetical protein PR202_ga09367 [Eleusine coracana subsp. coracana]|uniref:Uncharacterized protein n=1 Tax=Eleusine coracana subsp. coracana TaxID=191504 RepID=A0AAV5C3K1_ELECO|nr:hypothetical protein QOZ80_1AG0036580 [Eleusine coracana subsp. coracana]GJM92861.1 hypothetical protein PR202_ga09367 [Eleusine coracana subsp. coracana]
MSAPPPNTADSDDREGFTCSALLMCLYPAGRSSKKKPEEEEEEEASTSRTQAETGPAPEDRDADAEQEPPQVPSRAASFEKFECASLYSGNNIVFDFGEEDGSTPSAAVHGYCPSPCFDLPVELIRAGDRYGTTVADAPVTTGFVFADYQGAALKKMASCLAAGVEGRQPHLVRFLSASADSSVPLPPGTPSRNAPPKAAPVHGDHCEFAQRQAAGFPEHETVV